MPKYRKLWTKTVESHDINEMPDDFTRLLWVLLPLGLDSEGRGQDNTAWIKAKVFPLREDVTHERVSEAMAWYADRGMVVRYEVGRRRYFYVPTFAHYQGNTDKEAESEYPTPPLPTNSGPTPDLLPTLSASQGDAYAQGDAQGESTRAQKPRVAPPPLPPAIIAFREAMGGRLLPPKPTWPEIVKAIDDTPAALQKWDGVIRNWVGSGYNPKNVKGMLDWFKNGIPERKGRDNGTHQRDGQAVPSSDDTKLPEQMRRLLTRTGRPT